MKKLKHFRYTPYLCGKNTTFTFKKKAIGCLILFGIELHSIDLLE